MANLKKVSFLIIFLIFFVLFSCELYNTYSKDDYMKIGLKSDKEEEIIKKDLYIEQNSTNSTINDGGSFSFDLVPSASRCDAITFEIFNNGNNDLNLTGTPKVQIGSSDYEADCSTLPDTIMSGDSASFTIKYISNSTDGLKKSTLVNIPNSHNNNFIFSINCTAKLAGIEEYITVGTFSWTCPVHLTS